MSKAEFLIAIAIIAVIAAVIYGAVRAAHCVEWQETGATMCYGSEGYLRCEPERVCVRYDDE